VSRHGDGSVFFDKARNRWVGTIDAGRDHNGRRRRRKVMAPTRKEAAARLRHLRDELDRADAADGSTTVGAYLADWLAREVPKFARSPNTIDNYRWAVEAHLVPALGHIRLSRLTADDVDRMLEGKSAGGLARNSLVRLRTVLSKALDHAERRSRVVRNVARLTTVPAAPTKRRRSLTEDQAHAVLDAAGDDTRMTALILVGLTLGLRPGELLGLTWPDVDLDQAVIHVRRMLKKERNRPRLDDKLKTDRSRRSLAMPAAVVDALRAWRHDQRLERLAAGRLWGIGGWSDTDLVFTTTAGTPIDPSNLRTRFQRACDAAKVGRWTPYELRHSATSLLSAAGVPLEQIADLLGHTGTRMAAQVYRHQVTPTVEAAAAPMQTIVTRHR
jgi:integrase